MVLGLKGVRRSHQELNRPVRGRCQRFLDTFLGNVITRRTPETIAITKGLWEDADDPRRDNTMNPSVGQVRLDNFGLWTGQS